MDGPTKVYVSVEGAGRHLVLDGDLDLLRLLLQTVDRNRPRDVTRRETATPETGPQEVSEHAG